MEIKVTGSGLKASNHIRGQGSSQTAIPRGVGKAFRLCKHILVKEVHS
jgi:hypothetical protein